MICEICGRECSGKFCGKPCYKKWHYRTYYRKTLVCTLCRSEYQGYIKTKKPICPKCRAKHLPHKSGSENPNWRGGHRYWSPGRHGRDKDGLSWKTQRQLCWERDDYTCQGCGKHQEGWKPDVHHKIPYRISHSHHLDNLVSLCKRCHKKQDQRQEAMGELPPVTPPEVKSVCKGCKNRRRKLNLEGWCEPCYLDFVCVPKARELRNQGKSYGEIAKEFKVDHKSIWRWLNVGLKKSMPV